MLLSEKKVWKVVIGDYPQPETVETREEVRGSALTEAQLKTARKEIDDWDEKNEEALRIISFTVSDPLQAPIRYGKTAQGAWNELKRVHAPNDKQRKFSLLRRLYRIDMPREGSLMDHERVFDELVQNLADIGHSIDTEELIVLFANSLPQDTFGNWIQAQLAFIDGITITEFKGRVREEARRLNINGLSQTLGMDPDAVQANIARTNRIFPPRKPKSNFNPNAPKCTHCGYRNHTYDDCHKRIAEEYNAKQARKPPGGGGRGRGRGGGGNRGGKSGGNANFADANSNAGDSPAYSQIFGGLAFCSPQPAPRNRRRRRSNRKPQNRIFGGLAFCLKAALNDSIPRVGGVWIKDNGATHHMQYDKSLFSTYHRLRHRLFVGGIGSGLKAVGVGDVKITDPNGISRILKGVLHVPKLKCGLMSLNTLALDDINSLITRRGCTVSDGVFSIHSPIKNGLCVWSQHESHSQSDSEMGGYNALFAAIAPKKTSLTDLHERLGHYSKNSLLKHGDAIADLNIDPTERTNDAHQKPCRSCIMGKHARSPFPSRSSKRTKPLELVHSDLAESHVLSYGDGKYALTFVDDATHHASVFILPNKKAATVLEAFKDFQAWAERQSGHKVKELRTDRGTEYMGEMIQYVKEQGIEHHTTAGYSPQSNGVAERYNRTLFEMGCTMLDASGAPLALWADAILTANHILNRLPSHAVNDITPFEGWYGRKPTISHIRKWGCKVYRHINKDTGRKKLHKKSMIGFLMG
jgi:transposase InsO family protein